MKDEKAEELINRGSEIAGGAVGGAIGFLAGGPITAGAGAAVGIVCSHALKDLATRYLSAREKTRVGGAAAIALNEINQRLEKGEQIRSDGFFTGQGDERSSGEEVFEGIMLKAKQTHEEKKLVHIGKLFANIAFDESCSPSEANQLISIAESLNYSQFVILALAKDKESYKLRARKLQPGEQTTYTHLSLEQQAMTLFRLSLLKDSQHFLLSSSEIVPSQMNLTWEGVRLYEKLSLSEISSADVKWTSEHL